MVPSTEQVCIESLLLLIFFFLVYREFKFLSQGHKASQCQSQDSTQHCETLEPTFSSRIFILTLKDANFQMSN